MYLRDESGKSERILARMISASPGKGTRFNKWFVGRLYARALGDGV